MSFSPFHPTPPDRPYASPSCSPPEHPFQTDGSNDGNTLSKDGHTAKSLSQRQIVGEPIHREVLKVRIVNGLLTVEWQDRIVNETE
jgi:hypothetical protein